ncbi:MAG: metallophosphoesterase [Rhizomicrobium sp.]
MDEAKIRRVVALTNAARPDLVLLAGDYVVTGVHGGGHMPIDTIARLLAPLRAPLGVYAVLGNHDQWAGGADIAAAFAAVHIAVLENAARALPAPRGPALSRRHRR